MGCRCFKFENVKVQKNYLTYRYQPLIWHFYCNFAETITSHFIMTKFLRIGAMLLLLSACTTTNALDLKGILKDASSKNKNGTASTALGGLASMLSTENIDYSSMVGDWAYSSPAVSFRSGNLLKKAGGAAASSVVEEKLAPYYKTAGITGMTASFASDSTFTIKVRSLKLTGVVKPVTDANSDANLVLKFKAVKKISLGNMNTYISKSADGTTAMTFDIAKLVTLLEKAGSLTGNSEVNSVVKLLKSYDGICAGFRLKKGK